MDNSNNLSEFDHYFPEEFIDLYIDGDLFLEAYSKKQEHRVEKFLKENNFKEDPSKTTAEEKRKGYRRGTIETDITDENGKKKRVNFELTPHPNADAFNKATETIKISKKTASRKPRVASHSFKHEEGHAAIFFDKDHQKYGIEMQTIENEIVRFCKEYGTKIRHIFNKHDANPEEVFADRYAVKHSKYGGDVIKIPGIDKSIKTVGFIYDILYDTKRKANALVNKLVDKNGHIDVGKQLADMDKTIDQMTVKIKQAEDKTEELKVSLDKSKLDLDSIKQDTHRKDDNIRFNTDLIIRATKLLNDQRRLLNHFLEDINDDEIIKHLRGVNVNENTSLNEYKKIEKMFAETLDSCNKIIDSFVAKYPDAKEDVFFNVTGRDVPPEDREFGEEYNKAKHTVTNYSIHQNMVWNALDVKKSMQRTNKQVNDLQLKINEAVKLIDTNDKKRSKIIKNITNLNTKIIELESKIKEMKKTLASYKEERNKAYNTDYGVLLKDTCNRLNEIMNSASKQIISSLARSLMTLSPEERDELVKLDKAASVAGSFSENNVRGIAYYQVGKPKN